MPCYYPSNASSRCVQLANDSPQHTTAAYFALPLLRDGSFPLTGGRRNRRMPEGSGGGTDRKERSKSIAVVSSNAAAGDAAGGWMVDRDLYRLYQSRLIASSCSHQQPEPTANTTTVGQKGTKQMVRERGIIWGGSFCFVMSSNEYLITANSI